MHKPIKLSFDATPLCRKLDGVGRYTRELITAYSRQYPENTIYIIGFVGDHLACPEILENKNVIFIKLPFIRKLYSFLYYRIVRIPIGFLAPKADVFISTNFTLFPYIKTSKTIVAIHDLAYLRFPDTIERKNLIHLSKQVPLSVSESDSIIATSNFTKSEINSFFPQKENVYVVSNGINLDRWRPASYARGNYILAVGTLEPRKNLSTLLAAYEKLPLSLQTKHPLMLVGKKGWGDTQLSTNNKNIRYTGYVDDDRLIKYYQESRLFVMPSLYEGFGLPLLEAISTGTPVACSDIPSFRDIADNNATYFDPESISSIRFALEDSLRASKRKNVKPNIDRFSWSNSAKALDYVVLDTLGK